MKDGGPPDPSISEIKQAPNAPAANSAPIAPPRRYDDDDDSDDRDRRPRRRGGYDVDEEVDVGGDQQPTFDPTQPRSALQDVLNWRNRQRIAYMAMFSMITVMVALFFVKDPVRLEKLGAIATWFFGTMGTVVMSYYGFRTWSDIKGARLK